MFLADDRSGFKRSGFRLLQVVPTPYRRGNRSSSTNEKLNAYRTWIVTFRLRPLLADASKLGEHSIYDFPVLFSFPP
jgi:hypothetical protein